VSGDPVNPKNKFTWSQEFRNMLGFDVEGDFPNVLHSWSDRLHPDDKERTLTAFEAHIADRTGNTPYDIEYRLMLKTGEYRYFRAFGETLRGDAGIPLRVAGALQDIDESKQESIKVYYDGLTNIYNRRYFDENIARLFQSLSRSGGILSLMMIDIDYFKQYNDTYGHDAGDECLRVVADILSKNVSRADDFVARYGGEEFVVVLPNTNEDGAHLIADNFLNLVRNLRIPHRDSKVSDCLSLSIGVTSDRVSHMRSWNDFVKLADKMLYKSKQTGRNRYTFKCF
jgi:diguanylate cyclase (GGDEF)-like protein